MIYSIKGKVLNLKQQENFFIVALESGTGIGFNLKISKFTAKNCKVLGSEVRLFSYLVVRENALELFGFLTEAEKSIFKLLISVSGVGPSFAISILNEIGHNELIGLIANGNEKALCCCKGVGKKTASRIVLELKSKIEKFSFEVEQVDVKRFEQKKIDEAVDALVALGCEKSRAKKVVMSQLRKMENCSVEQLVKSALRVLF